MIGQVLGQTGGQIWDAIKIKFRVDENGNYFNERLEIEQNKRKAYSDSRKNNLTGFNQHSKRGKKQPKKSGHIGGHVTSDMENENRNEDLSNSLSTEKEGMGEKEKTWRDDFKIYLEGIREAWKILTKDEDWIKTQERFNPEIDVLLSLEKACKNYWATEAGWKKKKECRTKTIDWKQTLTNALSITSNKVYKSNKNKTIDTTYQPEWNERDQQQNF
jgi:hypothetical protein